MTNHIEVKTMHFLGSNDATIDIIHVFVSGCYTQPIRSKPLLQILSTVLTASNNRTLFAQRIKKSSLIKYLVVVLTSKIHPITYKQLTTQQMLRQWQD